MQIIDSTHPQYVSKGMDVSIHPACDYWMRGATTGTITSTPTVPTGRFFTDYVYVKLSRYNVRPVAIARRYVKPLDAKWPEVES